MWNEFEDPDFSEACAIAAICAVIASVMIMLVLHLAETPRVTAKAEPAIKVVSNHGR
jgi:ABC-type sulfate transport system permease component